MKSFLQFRIELKESAYEENLSFIDWIEETPTKKMDALLKEFGFRLIVPRAGVYLNSKWNMIVKQGNLLWDVKPGNPLYSFLVPTEKVKDASGEEWLVQPKVDRAESSKAFNEIKAKVGDEYYKHGDLHKGNTGYYKGKPVVFDW